VTHIKRWITLTVVLTLLLSVLPAARSYASSTNITSNVQVSTTYYLPQGSGWINSRQSEVARLPWGAGAAVQRVAVRWTLKGAASSALTGDYFTFSLPLVFSAEATASVLSAQGTPIGVATFARNGAVRVDLNTSKLSSAELPLTQGYVPFMVRRPSSTGGGSATDSGGAGAGSGATSPWNWLRRIVTGNDRTAPSPPSPGATDNGQGSEQTTKPSETTTTPSPPTSETTGTAPVKPAQPEKGKPDPLALDVGNIGTLVLSLISVGVFALAFLIARKRRQARRARVRSRS